MSQIAQTILKQLGGNQRVAIMTGADQFLAGDRSLSFKFKNSKTANAVLITLERDDTYTLKFTKIRGLKFTDVATVEGVYFDGLIDVFEKTTGLRLSL